MPQPSPMLRRTVALKAAVRSARMYVTSHGLYELSINGKRVGDDVLTPGWTSYATRLQYQTYDVTSLVRRGDNVLGALLGSGWYRGQIGFQKHRNHYGDRLALLAQLEVLYADGTRETVGSDAQWKAAASPIQMAEIYGGETYDARLEHAGWDAPGFDDASWKGVRVADHPKDTLIAPDGPPVRRIEQVTPVKILTSPSGQTIADMGQNMVGWVRLTVEGPAGTTVTLRHAEVLDQKGNFYTENLRAAAQQVAYTLKGGGREVFEPRFTFQGFRYVLVEGFPGTLALDNLRGIVVHSAIAPAGEFSTSDALINQLQHNIRWGQKGNFVDVPTDCPQRDERLGWTGDAQAFSRTAAFNMDVAGFFTKWLKDVAADQLESGAVPHVVPDVLTRPNKPEAAIGGMGRCRGHHPVEHVSELRRPARARDAVSEHDEVGRVHAPPRRRRLSLDRGLHVRRLARVCDDTLRLSRRDDRQGSDCDGILRAFDGSARADGRGPRQGRRSARVTRHCSRRSRPRSSRSS